MRKVKPGTQFFTKKQENRNSLYRLYGPVFVQETEA